MTLPTLIQIGGLVLEIVGVVLMANGYTRAVYGRGTLGLLIRALWRDPVIKEATRLRPLTREDDAIVLQGLAVIALGFLCQAGGLLLGSL